MLKSKLIHISIDDEECEQLMTGEKNIIDYGGKAKIGDLIMLANKYTYSLNLFTIIEISGREVKVERIR